MTLGALHPGESIIVKLNIIQRNEMQNKTKKGQSFFLQISTRICTLNLVYTKDEESSFKVKRTICVFRLEYLYIFSLHC